MPSPTPTVSDALESLRKSLLALTPSGPEGFEGLAATALAQLTGLVFRLAKSGLQFGRDASTSPGQFAIAMEAKRYSTQLSLDDLASKVAIAMLNLAGVVDLWVLAATAEVGDETVLQLNALLESQGMAMLVLDWTPRPLPPLAVLLAATATSTNAWYRQFAPDVAESAAAALARIGQAPDLPHQISQLREHCSAAKVGLGALRERSSAWFNERLIERGASRLTFGQPLNIHDSKFPAVPRREVLRRLDEAAAAAASAIIVLGEEGTGKSWVVSQWWTAWDPTLVPIFVSGRRVERLVVGNPLDGLASLLAESAGDHRPESIASLRMRLDRWSDPKYDGPPRFLLVLDGLNEHPRLPWSELIEGHADAIRRLGGILVATARPSFWQSQVSPRLDNDFDYEAVTVPKFSEEELESALAPHGVHPEDLAPAVRAFIANPRVCSLVAYLPPMLPAELTVERLLIEYWRHRLRDRGSLLDHTDQAFNTLLIEHARRWMERPQQSFTPETWEASMNRSLPYGSRDAAREIAEIQDGRFLAHDPHEPHAYSFRPEVLPFALGLLIVSELQDIHRQDAGQVSSALKTLLEPVQGFDQLGDIVAAAAGLACLDDTCPSAIRVLLVRAWCGLQNAPYYWEDPWGALAAYVPSRPDAFFTAAEAPEDPEFPLHLDPLANVILEARDHPHVAEPLRERAGEWLRTWSKTSSAFTWDDDARARYDEQYRRRVESNLEELSHQGLRLVFEHTIQRTHTPVVNLQLLAVLVSAGRPLAPLAAALFGWSVARTVAPDVLDADDALAWAVRLNGTDPAETSGSVRSTVQDALGASRDERSSAATTVLQRAAARTLRLVGDNESAMLAERWAAWPPSKRWRRVESFCDTNPYDPGAQICENLDVARRAVEALPPDSVYSAMGRTTHDSQLENALPALARFDPGPIVDFLRGVVDQIGERSGVSLRMLAFYLSGLSPLFETPQVTAVRAVLTDASDRVNGLEAREAQWVTASLAAAILPHVAPKDQHSILCLLPPRCPPFEILWSGQQPIPASILADQLTTAAAANDSDALKWALFLAVRDGDSQLPPAARDVIQAARANANPDVSALAKSFVERWYRHANVKATRHAHGNDHGPDAHPPGDAQGDEGATAIAKDVAFIVRSVEAALEAAGSPSTRQSLNDSDSLFLPPNNSALRQLVEMQPNTVAGWIREFIVSPHSNPFAFHTLGYGIVGAFAYREPELALSLLSSLDESSAGTRFTLNGIPLREAALFAANSPMFDEIRAATFRAAWSDAALETVTAAAETYGEASWLDAFMLDLLASPTPADVARALAIAGLRSPNALSNDILVRDYAPGFLRGALQAARKNQARDSWTRHWMKLASAAGDGVTFWRFGVLASGVADYRTAHFPPTAATNVFVKLFGEELEGSLRRTAEERTKKRKETLFGYKAPSRQLIETLERQGTQ